MDPPETSPGSSDSAPSPAPSGPGWPGPRQPTDFERCYLAHVQATGAVARRFFKQPSDAEEMVQEVWLKVLRLWREGKVPEEAFRRAWVIRVAVNHGIDTVRSGARRSAFELSVAVNGSQTVGDGHDRVEAGIFLERLIPRLAREQLDLLTEKLVEEFSLQEMAAKRGITYGTLYHRFREAMIRAQVVARRAVVGVVKQEKASSKLAASPAKKQKGGAR